MLTNKDGEPVKIEVELSGGKKAINNVYQLIVANQHDASCGPRALYNAQILSEVFDCDVSNVNDKKFVNPVDKLADLLDKDGSENPRLREFFKLMHGSKKLLEKRNDNGKIMEDENGNIIFESEKEQEERIFVGDFDFNQDNAAPQWVDANMLDAFVNYCAPERKKSFEIKNIDIMPGYEESFKVQPVERHGVEKAKKGYLVDSLKLKSVGYSHGYALLGGQFEIESGHWISIFVIKTGENEYNWFVLNSTNGDRLNNGQVKAYIYKLLGSNYSEYEDIVKRKREESLAAENRKIFDKISHRINALKDLNKDRHGADLPIRLDEEVRKIVVGYNPLIKTQDNQKPMRENLKLFFCDQINDLNCTKFLPEKEKEDLIAKILGLNGSDCVKTSDNFTDDKFVV
jgi:hypothetical protein